MLENNHVGFKRYKQNEIKKIKNLLRILLTIATTNQQIQAIEYDNNNYEYDDSETQNDINRIRESRNIAASKGASAGSLIASGISKVLVRVM